MEKIVLPETIKEGFRFEDLVTPGESSYYFDGSGVRQINSKGVKAWQTFFQNLRAAGVQLKFSEISPALMEQVNFLSGFINKNELESFRLAYACMSCKKVEHHKFTLADVGSTGRLPEKLPCPHCQKESLIEDEQELTLSFLK